MSPVNEKQPISAVVMNSTKCPAEHHYSQEEHTTSCPHSTRFRRAIIPATLFLLASAAVLLLEFTDLGSAGIGAAGGSRLLRRGNNSPFVQNKLYLIVVLVGLVLVLFAGIALSFWCCRSSFENPCCCPCYLCACCGGLACLECIGCGLCADALA